MAYKFWGWEHADAKAISDEYKGIKNPIDLYDALSNIWCADTCAPRMRSDWTKANMTLGQCSVTAFLAQDIFGGKVYGILRPGGNYHCYNVVDDCRFDLTSEQFGDEVLDYGDNPEQFREVHFAKEEKRLRYEYLKSELKKYCLNQQTAWPDGKIRCHWANPKNERYVRYHDEEWGIPVHDDGKLFEMLILECFQAGLSWECVLNKRDAFREAFDGFNLEKVCAYNADKLDKLIVNPGIIRNRLKIQASVTNAKIFRDIQLEYGGFSDYLWHFTDGKTVYENSQTSSPLSDEVSKDLKKRGMKFVGTTVVYAYLQAVGVINSHEDGCFLAEQKARYTSCMKRQTG